MRITLLEPYLTGSHAAWAHEYARHSRHEVTVVGLGGQHWKWRMHGGAVTLARRFLSSAARPDLLLATDMLDLTTFLALTRARTAGLPVALYFHENQLTYPWSPDDADPGRQRDRHYGFINYASALAADAVLFNSHYHRTAFLNELPRFLGAFPEPNESGTVERLHERSRVLPLGLDLRRLDACYTSAPIDEPPLILWNHRWEYDKNPESFFGALFQLADRGLPFRIAILGESYRRQPPIFAAARRRLHDRIAHWGYARDSGDYARWLWQAALLPVTSVHDFFGASVIQAIYCRTHPLLPRRLAYPEHLPGADHQRFFYDDDQDLLDRLATLLHDPQQLGQTDLRPAVQRYDWSEQAARYDAVMKEVAGR